MRFRALIACLFVLALFPACRYLSIGARDDMQGRSAGGARAGDYNSAVIMGRIMGGATNRPVMVLACPQSNKKGAPVEYVILKGPGPFMLYVPEGAYRLYSVTDFNDDGLFEEREVSGAFDRAKGLSVAEGEVRTDVAIRAKASAAEGIAVPCRFSVKDDASALPHQAANGEIVKIYDERFSMANADTGLWAPSNFMKAFGAYIYLTGPYDPRKLPVLFVHGSQGSPHTWAYFHFRLDRSKYQPWFFYYPSGIRLPLASRLLYEALLDLKKRYGYTRICITAHSMGGLVTRHLLTRYEPAKNGIEVKLYVTLASPWSGYESADRVLRMSSKKLPSWLDMASSSAFIKRTLQAPLPPEIAYYLFYGKRDETSQGRSLDGRACGGARAIYGFDVDHDTIMADRAVFQRYSSLLAGELR